MVAQAQIQELPRQSSGDDARERLLAALPVTERRLQLAGVSTAVLEGGDGPPVVLLHGPSGYAAHWMGVIPGLVTTHRVVVPDLPGHGASEVADGALDAARVLAWLGALIERTCISPPALVGQLLGGAIAARFAIDHGDRLSRLVLVDTFGLREFQPAPEFGLALHRFFADPSVGTIRISGALRIRPRRLAPADGGTLGAVRGLQPGTGPRAERADRRCRSHGAARHTGDPARRPRADRRAHDPDLGRHDRATPLSVAEAASARYGWPLHVIENCNDDPPVEQPEALLRVLRARSAAPDGWSKGGSHDDSGTRTDTRRMGQDRSWL